MLKKFSRSIERKRDGKAAVKFRFDVEVHKITGEFSNNSVLRVIWTRGSKVQMTKGVAVREGEATFNQHLSQIVTLYRSKKSHNDVAALYSDSNQFDSKEYVFKLQTVGPNEGSKKNTIGRAELDLSTLATLCSSPRPIVIPLTASSPAAEGLELHLTVWCALLKGVPIEDGLSTISGLSTTTSTSLRSPEVEQDLSGFDGVYRTMSSDVGGLTVSASADLCNSLSQVSEKSTDSTVVQEASAELVNQLHARIEELEAAAKKEAAEKLELQRTLDSKKRQSDSEVALLKNELEALIEQKAALENELVKEVEEQSGGPDIEEAIKTAVAPYEQKYQKLTEQYQESLQQWNNEVDALHDELLAYREDNSKLANSLSVSERARESLNSEKRALEMSLIGSCTDHMNMDKERKELRQELLHVDEVMQELIYTKLNLAQLSEKHTMARREMCKLKEKNLQLASKITKMETYLYYTQTGGQS